MDERIFNQLDQLERGARETRSFYDYSVNQSYDDHEIYNDNEQAMQLDSFDQRLLQQPDYQPHHRQAALGHARLSLPHTGHNVHQLDMPRPNQQEFATQMTRFSFNEAQSSSSPHHQQQPVSPSYIASRRHPPGSGGERLSTPEYRNRQQANQQQFTHRAQYHEGNESEGDNAFYVPREDQIRNPVPAKTRENMPVVQGIRLVSTRKLPDRVRAIFPFPLLNAVQSKCFDVIYNSSDNFVLSSPTGSGKTAVLELAICRLITSHTSGSFKIVYQAPTKSLCSERQRDWQAKFAPLELQCAELTGDTDAAQMRNVKHASIIITTPEKWDSMTRKWKDHQKLMQLVKLFLIDEIHILKEDRGATLEAIVSRMKGLGTDIRFVALSATVPNSQDIATWLGKNHATPYVPAPMEKFGEEFRPVKLQKHVCGYQNATNDFAFDSFLNGKLTDVIVKYSQHKPLMVFCFTRKACVETAKLLATWWSSSRPPGRYWEGPRRAVAVGESDLRETVSAGVGFHHAGLTAEDRLAVEQGYLRGDINVICCTSTLAVGVNLPCHMVIIKNTITYHSSRCKEYSDLEIMQMLGRAGRPQFDDSAVAVIMTRLAHAPFYEKMISGQEVLESCLHLNLIDHFNAEIGLGTIISASSAKKWLTGTFLYVRLRDHPEHYKLEGDAPGGNLDQRLETICSRAIALLEQNDLIRGSPKLQCTEFGDAMARYYLQFETMKNLLALPPSAKTSEILSAIAQAAEFKDVRFRAGEKPAYKELNKNISIKFPLPVRIDQPAHKVSLVIQSVLGAIDLPSEDYKARAEYTACKATVFQHASRLIRCIIDCQLYLEDSVAVCNALMLARSIGAQVWDDSPLTMKQLEAVGPVYVRKLVSAGIKSIEGILGTEAHSIEAALSRNPPFGTTLQSKAKAFPRLRISLKTMGEPSLKKGEGVFLRMKAEIGFLNDKLPEIFNCKPVYVCVLLDTSDGRKLHFARMSGKQLGRGHNVLFNAELTSAGQAVRGFVMCDDIAGTQQTAMLKPEIPTFMFPTPKKVEELGRQRDAASSAPNTFQRRSIAAARSRSQQEKDDFGNAGLDDDDLVLAEADGFTNLDDLVSSGDENKPAKKSDKSHHDVKRTNSEHKEIKESHQLPNGKWSCNHSCNNKAACKHSCCRDGLDKKPKPPKPKKPKNPKAADLSSDPKQTRLDMSKIKKFKPATQSAPTALRKPGDTKEVRNLNSVAGSVKSSTSQVPLLLKEPELVRNIEGAPLEDFEFQTLKSDDLFDDDDMLEFADGTQEDDNDGAHEGRVDLSSFADHYELDHDRTWSDFDDDSMYGKASNADSTASPAFQDANVKTPPARRSGMFLTDNISKSIDGGKGKASGADEYSELDDDVGLFPAAKRQKTLPQTISTQLDPEHSSTDKSPVPALLKGSEFLEEVLADEVAQADRAEKVEIGTKEWFLSEFGAEMFNFVD